MKIEEIECLMEIMEKRNISKFRLKKMGGFELRLERGGGASPEVEKPKREPVRDTPFLSEGKRGPDETFEKEGAETQHYIVSPMVGTFFSAPSPEDPPLVKVGDVVEEDTVVCIIEVMKVMNEIKAGKRGTIEAVLVENGHAVEFGTRLFRLV